LGESVVNGDRIATRWVDALLRVAVAEVEICTLQRGAITLIGRCNELVLVITGIYR
jgi:hypothetical protein